MSRLLVQGHGTPSSSLSAPGGGLVLAPDASRIASMRYGIKGGCKPYGLTAVNCQADLAITGLYFPTTSNVLFVTNVANGTGTKQTLALTRLTGTAGLLISGDDTDGDGQTFSPYFDNGTISADKEEGINTFTVGARGFYMKATIQVSSIGNDKNGDIFVGFAEAAVHVDDPDDLTEAYGFKIGEDHDNDGSVFEQSSTASTATFADTGTALAAATNAIVEVKVSAAGVATMTVDGVDQTKSTKTFARNTVLRPIIYNIETGGSTTQTLGALEFGFDNARK